MIRTRWTPFLALGSALTSLLPIKIHNTELERFATLRVEFSMLYRRLSIIGGKFSFRNEFSSLEMLREKKKMLWKFSLRFQLCWCEVQSEPVIGKLKAWLFRHNIMQWNGSTFWCKNLWRELFESAVVLFQSQRTQPSTDNILISIEKFCVFTFSHNVEVKPKVVNFEFPFQCLKFERENFLCAPALQDASRIRWKFCSRVNRKKVVFLCFSPHKACF